jgi:hypothetical protein
MIPVCSPKNTAHGSNKKALFSSNENNIYVAESKEQALSVTDRWKPGGSVPTIPAPNPLISELRDE